MPEFIARIRSERIARLDRQLARLASAHPLATRLQTIPGVGVLTATVLVGAVGDIHAFRRGREFASVLLRSAWIFPDISVETVERMLQLYLRSATASYSRCSQADI